MSTVALPTAADITRAVTDPDYYADQLAVLKQETDRRAFRAAVDQAYYGQAQTLTHVEQAILAFEHRHFSSPGRKEQAIRDKFGASATRYYQRLNRLIDNPAALAADPILVNRLRNLRAQRQARRSSNPNAVRRSAA